MNWVEFKGADGNIKAVLPEHIYGLGTRSDGNTTVLVDTGSSTRQFVTSEPYRQVKNKIEQAMRFDFGDVVVERFTDEEYATLYDLVVEEIEHGLGKTYLSKLEAIKDKLKEILKEEA